LSSVSLRNSIQRTRSFIGKNSRRGFYYPCIAIGPQGLQVGTKQAGKSQKRIIATLLFWKKNLLSLNRDFKNRKFGDPFLIQHFL
jgi:hypothetical protein